MNSLDHYDDDPDQAFVKEAVPDEVISIYDCSLATMFVLWIVAMVFIFVAIMLVSLL